MAKLTERRLEAAKPILERYRDNIIASHSLEVHSLEQELKDCLKLGYQELKHIMIDLAKTSRYRLVAAYYMQHQNGNAPVSEFKPTLARLYGTADYDPFDKDGKQKRFWENAFKEASLN